MRINDDFLIELRSRLDIETVISPYVNLKRAGRLSKGLCPFHNEKTPSFTVYNDSQSFYCFGCGAGGDIITFKRKIENYDYLEAVKALADMAGLQMPTDNADDSIMKLRARILSANREAARFFYSTLTSKRGAHALDYLLSRGISAKMIKHFGLGFAPDSWDALIKHMHSKGYTNAELFEANLVRKSVKGDREHYYDNFKNRIMIPIIDLRGNIIAFGGRVMDDSKPKYINTSDTLVYKKSNGVFALNFAKDSREKTLIVAEGYMDVIALHQAGFENSIACLGTALTSEQARLVARYAQEVVLAYDSDEAGQKATNKAIRIFGETGVKIRVLNLAGGKDPDEIIKKNGAEAFRRLVDGAANDTEFAILKEKQKYDITTDDGKLNFLNAVTVVIAAIDNPIERDIYISRISNELQVQKQSIEESVKEAIAKKNKINRRERMRNIQKELIAAHDEVNPGASKNIRAARAEEVLVANIIRNPDFYKKLENKITPQEFVTDFYQRLFASLSERLSQGRSIELSMFAGDFNEKEMGRIAKLSSGSVVVSSTIDECLDCIKVIAQEKAKQEDVDPAKISDEEYLETFKKKRTDG